MVNRPFLPYFGTASGPLHWERWELQFGVVITQDGPKIKLMDSFTDFLTRWQPFFSAVAGVAATLAGLLFVSLSLNREKITAQENRILLRLARRSFGDLLYALFIALMFLMPNHVPYPLAIPLICFSAVRGWLLVRSISRSSKTGWISLTKYGLLRDYSFQAVTCLGLLVAAVEIYRGNILAAYLLVPIISFLLYNAGMNAWLLLMMEKKVDEKSATPLESPST